MTQYSIKITLDVSKDFREQVVEAATPAIADFLEEHGTDLGGYDLSTFTRFMDVVFDTVAVAVLNRQVTVHCPNVVEEEAAAATMGL